MYLKLNHGSAHRGSLPALAMHHVFILVVAACCCSVSSASRFAYIEEAMVESARDRPATGDLHSTLARLAQSGTILVDQSPPPEPPASPASSSRSHDWTLATVQDGLQRRTTSNDGDDPFGAPDSSSSPSSSSSSSPPKSTTESASEPKQSSTSTLAPTTSSSGNAAVATSASPLPQPFDTGFSGTISANCADFMSSMLQNSTFQSCRPFSLLLRNSNSFFQASKSITRISQTLDATCAANATECNGLMTSFATNITTDAACASDLITENPLVVQAHLGLLAYKPLYTASCLRDPVSSSYCFADAVTNKSSSTDSYIYYLPLNTSLPGGRQPTCNKCLQDTMAVFGASGSDRSSALAQNYASAAMQINVQCGPEFVSQSLAAPESSFASPSLAPSSNTGVLALGMILASWLL